MENTATPVLDANIIKSYRITLKANTKQHHIRYQEQPINIDPKWFNFYLLMKSSDCVAPGVTLSSERDVMLEMWQGNIIKYIGLIAAWHGRGEGMGDNVSTLLPSFTQNKMFLNCSYCKSLK